MLELATSDYSDPAGQHPSDTCGQRHSSFAKREGCRNGLAPVIF